MNILLYFPAVWRNWDDLGEFFTALKLMKLTRGQNSIKYPGLTATSGGSITLMFWWVQTPLLETVGLRNVVVPESFDMTVSPRICY